jgi:hypothetical protein
MYKFGNQGCIRAKGIFSSEHHTYYRPQYTLEFQKNFLIERFFGMFFYESGKFMEVTFLAQKAATSLGLGYFTVKMWRGVLCAKSITQAKVSATEIQGTVVSVLTLDQDCDFPGRIGRICYPDRVQFARHIAGCVPVE